MKKTFSREEIDRAWAEIDARPEEEPSAEDLTAIEAAKEENPESCISMDEYSAQREYSGKILLRIPKELHKLLAESAKENGVSINQYMLYKLAR